MGFNGIRTPDEKIERMFELRKEGLTSPQISRAIGVPRPTVDNYLQKMDDRQAADEAAKRQRLLLEWARKQSEGAQASSALVFTRSEVKE